MSQQPSTNVPQAQRQNKKPQNGDKQGKSKDGFTKKNNNQRGGQNQGPKHNAAGGEKKRNTKTVFVAKIYMDDLEKYVIFYHLNLVSTANENLSRVLKGQRIKFLRDTMATFGDIERVEYSEEQQNVNVTYVDRKSAIEALKVLKRKEKLEEFLDNIRLQLVQQKLPEACTPKLLLYRFGWADNVVAQKGPKNVYKQSNEAATTTTTTTVANVVAQPPKNVVANAAAVVAQKQQPAAKPEAAEGKKEKKKPKANKEKAEIDTMIEDAIMSEEQRRAATDTLRREAEIAKLKEDKNYLNKQQTAILQELGNERERVKDREARINVLLSDLDRVNQEKQRLEEQLSAEQSWKKKGEETITKLEDEMKHIDNQSQQNEVRLKQVAASKKF